MSPDGHWVATGAWNDNRVRVWNLARGSPELDLPTETMANVSFSPDSRYLVTNSRKVICWKVGTWETAFQIARPPLEVFPSPIAFSPDGKVLALCHSIRSVTLVAPDTGKEYATLELPDAWWIAGLSFNPRGDRLALSGLWTKEFCVWDLRRIRERLATLKLDWDLPPYSVQ